jgi:hypothetical protein
MPLWSLRPIRSVAVQRDLYTTVHSDSVSDETERWFAQEIEQPGLEASEHLIAGKRLSRDEWHAVIRLYALQETRTPQSYIEAMRRWGQSMPEVLERTLHESVQELERGRAAGRVIEPRPSASNAFDGVFKVELRSNGSGTGGTLSASVVLGRRLWIAGIRHTLDSKPNEALLRHQWSVLIPADGYEWPLTDHPALRLGYQGPNRFNFQAGVRRRHADLMMPLSPYHLLHAEVGKTRRGVHQLTREQTIVCRSALLKRAHRVVFSTRPVAWIPREYPRIVDRKAFEWERAQWQHWHAEQSLAELA